MRERSLRLEQMRRRQAEIADLRQHEWKTAGEAPEAIVQEANVTLPKMTIRNALPQLARALLVARDPNQAMHYVRRIGGSVLYSPLFIKEIAQQLRNKHDNIESDEGGDKVSE